MADCNTYHCSACGELLELMNPDIIYCLCGYANSAKDTSFCISCWNPLTKDAFLEIFPEHHEIHKTHDKHEFYGFHDFREFHTSRFQLTFTEHSFLIELISKSN